jgi:hypothetical protein
MSDVLRIEDLDTAGQWLHSDVGPHLERSYRQATGWSGAEALGLAAVVGRLAYTRGRTMPPGGDPRACTSNGCYLIRVDSDVRGEQARRRRVHVVTGLRQRDGAAVAEVGFVLDWPVVTPCG